MFPIGFIYEYQIAFYTSNMDASFEFWWAAGDSDASHASCLSWPKSSWICEAPFILHNPIRKIFSSCKSNCYKTHGANTVLDFFHPMEDRWFIRRGSLRMNQQNEDDSFFHLLPYAPKKSEQFCSPWSLPEFLFVKFIIHGVSDDIPLPILPILPTAGWLAGFWRWRFHWNTNNNGTLVVRTVSVLLWLSFNSHQWGGILTVQMKRGAYCFRFPRFLCASVVFLCDSSCSET